jgi:hypothetical protein
MSPLRIQSYKSRNFRLYSKQRKSNRPSSNMKKRLKYHTGIVLIGLLLHLYLLVIDYLDMT